MKVLGIESSCDETSASVVEDGSVLHSFVVASSMDLHTQYGGVVPEIAARSHIEAINAVIEQALWQAKYGSQAIGLSGVQGGGEQRTEPYKRYGSGVAQAATQQSAKSTLSKSGFARLDKSVADRLWDDIDAIAVTYGAGLSGSLLIGVLAARTLAALKKKPLYAINHVEAHVYANFITSTGTLLRSTKPRKSVPAAVGQWQLNGLTFALPSKQPEFPMLAVIVSGGHSQLALFQNHFDYVLLGQTGDDAIGEAFDKVAKIIGLPYPGGPSIGKKALEGDAFSYEFPKAKMAGKYDFSFSGLKTAVLRTAQAAVGRDFTLPSKQLPALLNEEQKANIAASFQRIAIETIVDKANAAFEEYRPASVVIAGGVAASPELRRQLSERLPIPIEYTDPKLCTDNGAMIATLGCYKAMLEQPPANAYTLDIAPNLSM
ncbi:MAG: tRNA (adenosine(37)-N6)-threonylcarbamoyltransferase complex transferase subunit TsaD [Candidatus Saccharimonadales bacterium]